MTRRLTIFAASLAILTTLGCQPYGGGDGRTSMSLRTDYTESPWRSPYANGQEFRSANYVLYSTTSNRRLATTMPGFMEAARRHYLDLTALPPARADEPMPIYLMGTRDEWARLTRRVVGPQAPTYLSIEAGGYCYRGVCVFWDLGGLNTFSIASHEGMHQLFDHRLRDPLPRWLEEGLCAVAEGYEIHDGAVTFTPLANPQRYTNLRAALSGGHWTPLAELLPLQAGDVVTHGNNRAVQYYGQLWALVSFIRSNDTYRAGMEKLLVDAAAGRIAETLGVDRAAFSRLRANGVLYNRTLSEPMFRHYINADLDAFQREYTAYARTLADLD